MGQVKRTTRAQVEDTRPDDVTQVLFTGRRPTNRYVDLAVSRHRERATDAGGQVEPDEWTRLFVALALIEG